MPISSFERVASTSAKKLQDSASISFISCCFRSVSNPLYFKFLRTPYRKKEKLCYSPVSSVLLTKFGISVPSVWSPGLIKKLTIMKWPSDFRKVGTASQVASYIFDYVLDEEPQSEKFETELFYFDMLLINKFYIKKYIFCWLNKIMLGDPCTNF